MDEDARPEEKEPRKTKASSVISDVWCPFPGEGRQVKGPSHKTKAEPEAEWPVQCLGLVETKPYSFTHISSQPNTQSQYSVRAQDTSAHISSLQRKSQLSLNLGDPVMFLHPT